MGFNLGEPREKLCKLRNIAGKDRRGDLLGGVLIVGMAAAIAALNLTLKTFPPAYADYVFEIADANKDRTVTLVEWTSAGGDKRSFLLADQNKDDVITRTELVRIGSNGKLFDMTRRYADFNKDNRLTPREFRSSAGVRVLRFDF